MTSAFPSSLILLPSSLRYSFDMCVESSLMVGAHSVYCDADEIASVGCVFIERTIAHGRAVNFNRAGCELERDLQCTFLGCDVIPANVNRGQDQSQAGCADVACIARES